MAQKVQVLLIDDLDGSEAEETVTFALDGSSYEIDLSSSNAKRLREELAPFIEAARRVPSRRSAPKSKQRTVLSRERSAQIRAWAQQQGKQISERGRIPKAIVERFVHEQNVPDFLYLQNNRDVTHVAAQMGMFLERVSQLMARHDWAHSRFTVQMYSAWNLLKGGHFPLSRQDTLRHINEYIATPPRRRR